MSTRQSVSCAITELHEIICVLCCSIRRQEMVSTASLLQKRRMSILKRFLIRLFCRGRVIPLFCLMAGILYFSRPFCSPRNRCKETVVRQPFSLDEVSVVKKPTREQAHSTFQKEEEEIEYIQETQMDLPGGDIPCIANESCLSFRVRSPEQAKVICNSYGSRCKGFVYFKETGNFYPKGELENKMMSKSGFDLYIKKDFAESALQNETQCAVPLKQFQSVGDACRLPELDPHDQRITKLIRKPEPLHCPGSQLTRYRRGVLELSKDAVGNIASVTCQPILRPAHKDWGFELGNETSLNAKERQLKLDSEFIRVHLTTTQGAKYVEYHAQILPRSPKQDYSKVAGLPLSVVIIGFDSLSAAHFQRALPEAYKFMTEEMNSVFLKGYSVVGDGTTPALAALMTGKFESELPEARRGFPGSEPLDHWSHIFKDFKAQGYKTLFSEDCPRFAAFNYRLHGFKEPPTDHYSRYFWAAAGITSPHCIQSKPQHQIHFDYMKSFLEAYRGQPKFGLYFMTDISHNKLYKIYLCADDFVSLLKDLSEGSALNDTLLIVMSDHGVRIGDARATLQGKLEERLPLMSLTFPKWFSQKYPDLLHNLKENSNIVTSPFDLYATFRHILNFPRTPVNLKRGESLFNKINRSRDCESTGVAEHYCPCLQWKGIDTRTEHARHAAQAVVDHVNNLTASDTLGLKLCLRLQLQEILTAHQKIPNMKLTQYLGPSDRHGRKPMFSRRSATLDKCLYQVQLRTIPGKGLFEASVSFDGAKYGVTGEISRINLYGEQPRCILDKSPHLRKYCLCKDYKGTME